MSASDSKQLIYKQYFYINSIIQVVAPTNDWMNIVVHFIAQQCMNNDKCDNSHIISATK